MFALFGLSCTRFAVTICPALLKSLSVGALLAGMARYRRAYCDRRGNHSHGISTTGVGRHLHQLSEIASIGQFRLPHDLVVTGLVTANV